MKRTTYRPLANADAAMRKLFEMANAMEADMGRLPIGALNTQFITGAGGSVAEYSAAMKAASRHGYFTMHQSGGYVSFTQAGADLFARERGYQ